MPPLERQLSARRSSLTTPCDLIFKSADEDNDGFLNMTELRVALEKLKEALPAEEAADLAQFLSEVTSSDDDAGLREVFDEINKSKTGLITYEEFANCEFFEVDD